MLHLHTLTKLGWLVGGQAALVTELVTELERMVGHGAFQGRLHDTGRYYADISDCGPVLQGGGSWSLISCWIS